MKLVTNLPLGKDIIWDKPMKLKVGDLVLVKGQRYRTKIKAVFDDHYELLSSLGTNFYVETAVQKIKECPVCEGYGDENIGGYEVQCRVCLGVRFVKDET